MKNTNIPWLLVLVLLVLVFPLGVVLLIIKLSESNTRPSQNRNPQPPPAGWKSAGPKVWSQPTPPPRTHTTQTPPPPKAPPRPAARPTPPPQPRDDMDEKLLALRAAARTVVTPKMQLKAGDICNTTEKIFDHVRKHPEKREKLSRFEQFYLPTTTHLLERYSELEKQPHPGENITSALGKIDDAIDTVDTGFKKQLDQLFSADAVDISADVRVMEQLFAKDGLQEDDFSFDEKKASS